MCVCVFVCCVDKVHVYTHTHTHGGVVGVTTSLLKQGYTISDNGVIEKG